MPIARFQLPDGRIARFEVPEGTTPEQAQEMMMQAMPPSAVARQQASAIDPAKQQPTEGLGESMLIAAGRGTDKVVQGVRQAYNWATNDQAALDRMAQDEAYKDKAYQPLRDKFPIATGIGEAAPALAAFPLGGGASLLKAGASAALPSILSYGTAGERLQRGITDAAFGAAGAKLGQVVAGVLKPAGVGAAGASDDALAAAKRIGFKPTPGQITQNPGMLGFENYLARSPGASGAMQRVNSANQAALNRAGAKAMGESADDLGEGVFAAAKDRIGAEFARLSDVTKPTLADDFVNTLAKIDADNVARGPFASKSIQSLVDKGLELASKGDLDGKAYKQIRTELSNQAQAAYKAGDATTGQAYKSLREALDKAAKDSLSEADKAAWDVARQQWSAFKTLTKSNVAEGGNVSAARAAAAVRAQGPALRTGSATGELADVARVGEAFKGVPNPTSGQLMQQMLYGNPLTGVPIALANRAAAAAYMSPIGQRYFSRGLIDVGPTGRSLLGRAGLQLTVPGGRGLLGVE